jgi:hypothetical protein
LLRCLESNPVSTLLQLHSDAALLFQVLFVVTRVQALEPQDFYDMTLELCAAAAGEEGRFIPQKQNPKSCCLSAFLQGARRLGA